MAQVWSIATPQPTGVPAQQYRLTEDEVAALPTQEVAYEMMIVGCHASLCVIMRDCVPRNSVVRCDGITNAQEAACPWFGHTVSWWHAVPHASYATHDGA